MKLQDIYYGNITPCQHSVKSESEYAKHSLELLEMCEFLEKSYHPMTKNCSTK